MHWFLKTFILPLLEALRPAVIVEVGVELGRVTEPLLEWAESTEGGAVVHAIDPSPKLEVKELLERHAERLRFHGAPSLEALPGIANVDVALIDGDHNWYTVMNELRALTRRAAEDGRRPPVMLLHDIGWPYGRRDLYYDPERIPAEQRQRHARRGIVPGERELDGRGVNSHLHNAWLEGTPANGVLTAVEDFMAESRLQWRLQSIPGLSGLGVLVDGETYERNERVRGLLESIEGPDFLHAQCEAIERARLDSEVRRDGLKRKLEREEEGRGVAAPGDPGARDTPEAVAELGVAAPGGPGARDTPKAVAELERELEAARAERDELTYTLAQMWGRGAGAPPWERELEARGAQAFLEAYLPILSRCAPVEKRRDPLSLPLPDDRLDLLCAADETQEPGRPSVDVVVCVRDALEDVRRCLQALLSATGRRLRLIVVDDGSGERTRALLRDVAARNPALTLIRREGPAHGYTLAANEGMEASGSDYVVLLNSDTIVTAGWLQRLVEHGERHPQVGILGPLSNAASHQSVPRLREGSRWAVNALPEWLTEEGMAAIVERAGAGADVRLPFLNGFCYAMKREVIESIGGFDEERFAEGYCEENDYSHRAYRRGYGLAVVADAYVHHAKSRSYGEAGRKELARRHYEAFLEKHDRAELEELVAGMEASGALEPVREAVAAASASPHAAVRALHGEGGRPLEVVFVLPGLAEGGSGGSHSIYQEVKGMRELGIPARIALQAQAWERARSAYEDAQEIFEVFADAEELAANTAGADVISATHYKSVALLRELRSRREDFVAAYYVQDYEPFFSAPESEDLQEALASYTALADLVLFAKTDWLCNVVGARHGVLVHRVQPSIDERVFFAGERGARGEGLGAGEPSPTPGGVPLRVIAMIRPRTPRRRPAGTVALLERLQEELGEAIEVSTFGCSHAELARLTRSRALIEGHLGVLSRAAVAERLRASDVFVDMSTYQAFGRSALEAMACGATAVVPEIGGAWEFVEDGVNALAVDTLDPEAAFAAVSSLAKDRALLSDLQAAATTTAARYSITRAALSEYVLFERAHRGTRRRPQAAHMPLLATASP